MPSHTAEHRERLIGTPKAAERTCSDAEGEGGGWDTVPVDHPAVEGEHIGVAIGPGKCGENCVVGTEGGRDGKAVGQLVKQVERAARGQGPKERNEEGLAERRDAGGRKGFEEEERALGVCIGGGEEGTERER